VAESLTLPCRRQVRTIWWRSPGWATATRSPDRDPDANPRWAAVPHLPVAPPEVGHDYAEPRPGPRREPEVGRGSAQPQPLAGSRCSHTGTATPVSERRRRCQRRGGHLSLGSLVGIHLSSSPSSLGPPPPPAAEPHRGHITSASAAASASSCWSLAAAWTRRENSISSCTI
jgi:hypothetical protein